METNKVFHNEIAALYIAQYIKPNKTLRTTHNNTCTKLRDILPIASLSQPDVSATSGCVFVWCL